MSNIIDLTLVELVSKIKNKEISSKEVTSAYVERCEKCRKMLKNEKFSKIAKLHRIDQG